MGTSLDNALLISRMLHAECYWPFFPNSYVNTVYIYSMVFVLWLERKFTYPLACDIIDTSPYIDTFGFWRNT